VALAQQESLLELWILRTDSKIESPHDARKMKGGKIMREEVMKWL
jgi:hypothetical protein